MGLRLLVPDQHYAKVLRFVNDQFDAMRGILLQQAEHELQIGASRQDAADAHTEMRRPRPVRLVGGMQ